MLVNKSFMKHAFVESQYIKRWRFTYLDNKNIEISSDFHICRMQICISRLIHAFSKSKSSNHSLFSHSHFPHSYPLSAPGLSPNPKAPAQGRFSSASNSTLSSPAHKPSIPFTKPIQHNRDEHKGYCHDDSDGPCSQQHSNICSVVGFRCGHIVREYDDAEPDHNLNQPAKSNTLEESARKAQTLLVGLGRGPAEHSKHNGHPKVQPTADLKPHLRRFMHGLSASQQE